MVNARPHHGQDSGQDSGQDPQHPDAARPGRLNLLLSSAPWDRESWAQRLPPLLEPIGVRALHARSGSEAKQVLERQPIHIAVVDLALPLAGDQPEAHYDEGGSKLLQVLARLAAPPPTLVIKRARTTQDDRRELAAALRAGAFAVLDRPRSTRDLELMLEALRRCLHRHYSNQWPRT